MEVPIGERKRFTKAFEDRTVWLAVTGGRTQRFVAKDLGISLSTLTRWIGRGKDRLKCHRTPTVASHGWGPLKSNYSNSMLVILASAMVNGAKKKH
jgi:Transposase